MSTGEVHVSLCASHALDSELVRLSPAEVLVETDLAEVVLPRVVPTAAHSAAIVPATAPPSLSQLGWNRTQLENCFVTAVPVKAYAEEKKLAGRHPAKQAARCVLRERCF